MPQIKCCEKMRVDAFYKLCFEIITGCCYYKSQIITAGQKVEPLSRLTNGYFRLLL